MTKPYTLGDWHVKVGSEEVFVAAWLEFAEWTSANFPDCTFAKLLRDESDPGHFVSVGPWSDTGAVTAWRGHPDFQVRVNHLRGMLESFVPYSMNLAGEVGPPTPDPW